RHVRSSCWLPSPWNQRAAFCAPRSWRYRREGCRWQLWFQDATNPPGHTQMRYILRHELKCWPNKVLARRSTVACWLSDLFSSTGRRELKISRRCSEDAAAITPIVADQTYSGRLV